MSEQEAQITLTVTRKEASELIERLEWTNEPNWKSLIWRLREAINLEEASTKDLSRPGADSFSQTDQTIDKD